MSSETTSLSSPLIWLKAEIDRTLGVARAALAQAVNEPDSRPASLESCESQARQVRGAMTFVGLDGAARFCHAIEAAVRCYAESAAKLNHVTASIIDRSMFALSQYLDDIAKGEADVPLKLFPLYRELWELSGRSEVLEIELFYPDIGLVPPAHPSSKRIASADMAKYVVACRAHYLRFLGLWQNEPGKSDALHGMRAALDALDQVAAQLETPAGFWWAAVGFVEAVIQRDARVLELPVKDIFDRIESVMQELASEEVSDCFEPMRQILYPLALSAPVSRRVRDAKQLFQLDQQLPEFCVSGTLEYDLAAMTPALDDMRRRLSGVEEAWVQYTSGDADALRRLRDDTTALKNIARDLGFYRLVRLLDVIGLIASKLPEPYPRGNEVLALEMASALLFMERMLDQFVSPPPDLDQQVAVMVGWLLDAVKPAGPGGPKTGAPRDDITQRQSYAQVRAQVAREILENLRQVEQIIDQIARNPTTREEIINLDTPVRQIAGALKMLGLSRANGVLSTCQHLMKLSVSGEITLTYASLEWVADGLSCLGFYLDRMQRGEQPSEDILIGFLQRLGREDARPAGSTGWVPAAVEPEAVEDAGNANSSGAPRAATARKVEPSSPAARAPGAATTRQSDNYELRAVYVEEAHEVLASIAPALERLGVAPADHDALVEIRRAYHTLKGSGRLVGLDVLGDLAAEIEKTVDLWLDAGKPVTAALLEMIGDASEALLGAAQAIESGRLPEAHAFDDLVGQATALREELGAPDVRFASESGPSAAGHTPQTMGEIVVGDVRLSEALYQIYLRETRANLSALDAELTRCECEPDYAVSTALIRAAHTIKSSSRTTGFTVVADLADDLEQCLHTFEGKTLGPEVLEAAWNARDALSAMLADVGQQQPPRAANAQRNRLSDIAAAASNDPGPKAAAAKAEELDAQLLPVFLEEANQLLPEMTADLAAWRNQPSDMHRGRSLARALHTLKGSARMAGCLRIGELTHAVESRIGMAVESGEGNAETFEALQRDLDRIAEWVDELQTRAASLAGAALPASAPTPELPGSALPAAAAQIRVNSDMLDRLVNQAGEISIARARIEGEMEALKQSLHDLTDSVSRLRTQLRETQIQADSQMQSRLDELQRDDRQFDPLELDRYTRLQELTRMMAESLHDVQMIQQTLVNNSSETESALAQQGRIDRDLQQDLLQLRSMPFGLLSERLQRTVRQIARELGRSVKLEIKGEHLDVDRSVLQRIGAPLEHMLRNAVVHGIEPSDQRRAQGKLEVGRIALTLAREQNENVIVLSDDGAGLDARLIRLKALRMGLLAPGDAVADPALHQLIFAPGFSTAPTVTETSGRGVGMDVVRAEVAAIGGRIEVSSEAGAGTTFRIRFPLTLAATQTILVRAAANLYAIPSSLVEQIQEIKPEEVVSAYESGSLPWNGTDYPLHYLPRLLGQAENAAELIRHNPVLMLSSGENRLAVHVDQILRNQEVVLKSIGPQLARVPGVVGATVLGTGQVVLLLNPVRLHASGRVLAALGQLPPPRVVSEKAPAPHIMVVDDSLTVRRISERLLTREGYQVSTAKDGVDAIQQMQDALPDLIIADIEMPRMDGFELTKQLRSDARMKAIPIIVVSSRMAEKHRRHALELGADAFFGKPYDEEDLLARVTELLDARSRLSSTSALDAVAT